MFDNPPHASTDRSARASRPEGQQVPGSFLPSALVVLTVALAARAWTAGCLGILPNLDSFDYLAIGRQLAAGNWSPDRLGDVRLPGYPVFLALLAQTSQFDAQGLIVAQKILGTAAALGFAWSAWRLAGPLAALALGLFTALHPVLLLFEHQAMSETLFVASLALVLVTAVSVRRRGHSVVGGLVLGLAAGASMLVRVNGAVLVGMLLVASSMASPEGQRSSIGVRASFVGTLALGYLALIGPWLVAQQLRFGRPSLVDYPEVRYIYLAQHGLIDPALPRFAPHRTQFDPADGRTTYQVMESMRLRRLPTRFPILRYVPAEERIFRSGFERNEPAAWSASEGGDPGATVGEGANLPPGSRHGGWRTDPTTELVREQIAAQSTKIWGARRRSFVALLGLSGRSTARAWGQRDVRDSVVQPLEADQGSALDSVARHRRALARLLPGSEPALQAPAWARWKTWILAYLDWGRGILSLTFLASLTLRLLMPTARRAALRDPALLALTLGWSATLAIHAWHLAALERFATPLDPVLLLATILAGRAVLPVDLRSDAARSG